MCLLHNYRKIFHVKINYWSNFMNRNKGKKKISNKLINLLQMKNNNKITLKKILKIKEDKNNPSNIRNNKHLRLKI